VFGDHKLLLQAISDIEQIKRELRDLTVDLPELQRKMVRVLRNTARERARMEELDTPTEERVTAAKPEVGNGPHMLLSPRQKQIQQEILKRRAGG
jgi:hypothetical protein